MIVNFGEKIVLFVFFNGLHEQVITVKAKQRDDLCFYDDR